MNFKVGDGVELYKDCSNWNTGEVIKKGSRARVKKINSYNSIAVEWEDKKCIDDGLRWEPCWFILTESIDVNNRFKIGDEVELNEDFDFGNKIVFKKGSRAVVTGVATKTDCQNISVSWDRLSKNVVNASIDTTTAWDIAWFSHSKPKKKEVFVKMNEQNYAIPDSGDMPKAWQSHMPKASQRDMREFDTGATRSSADGKYEYIGFNCPLVDERYARYMHKHRKQEDGKMRVSNNWKKGMPLQAYQESAGRHWIDIRKHWDGYAGQDSLEDSICAMMFNLKGYLHEVLKEKED